MAQILETPVTAAVPPSLPPLRRDPSFWGMTATQFLGAFNDNLFKQLVLLLCLDAVNRGGRDLQFVAMALFALPFVAFSGFAGWLADRYSKRAIVVLAKVAEIAVMLAGMAAFLYEDPSAELVALLIVLAFMGTQSAFFGPSKYGILPELFREGDLPQVNGAVQMTTFVAIIFGMALAGFTKDWFERELWMVSLICVGIAVAGTLTSLIIRRTPIAHPGMPFAPSSLVIHRETWRMLRADWPLMKVLLISSLFWFLGGVVQPSVNAFGKTQMLLGDSRTSLLAACLGVGIAIGCILAGVLSRHRVSFGMVRVGAWGVVLCLAGTAWLGAGSGEGQGTRDEGRGLEEGGTSNIQHLTLNVERGGGPRTTDNGQRTRPESFTELLVPGSWRESLARLLMLAVGLSAGLFVVPLQVFMQARPPRDQRGRMIGAMNLVNWIGIVLSAAFYGAAVGIFASFERAGVRIEVSWIFAGLALLLLPVALFYRPRDEQLHDRLIRVTDS